MSFRFSYDSFMGSQQQFRAAVLSYLSTIISFQTRSDPHEKRTIQFWGRSERSFRVNRFPDKISLPVNILDPLPLESFDKLI